MRRVALSALVGSSLAFGAAGCRTVSPVAAWQEVADPCAARPPHPAASGDGSLYVPGTASGLLFGEQRAHRLCDHVTIRVEHQTTATQETTLEAGRSSSAEAGIDALAGLDQKLSEANPGLDLGALLGAGAQSSFNGSGRTSNSGKVTGSVTARVVDVLPNGFLRLYAEAHTKVNDDIQVVALTGVVDPRAIGADDSVSSEALFDARVEISNLGGPSRETIRMPWGIRLTHAIAPF